MKLVKELAKLDNYDGTVVVEKPPRVHHRVGRNEYRQYEDVLDLLAKWARVKYPLAHVVIMPEADVMDLNDWRPVDGRWHAAAWREIVSDGHDFGGTWATYESPEFSQTYTATARCLEVGHHVVEGQTDGQWYTSEGYRDSERHPITESQAREELTADQWDEYVAHRDSEDDGGDDAD